jgi:hypothetical protein
MIWFGQYRMCFEVKKHLSDQQNSFVFQVRITFSQLSNTFELTDMHISDDFIYWKILIQLSGVNGSVIYQGKILFYLYSR